VGVDVREWLIGIESASKPADSVARPRHGAARRGTVKAWSR